MLTRKKVRKLQAEEMEKRMAPLSLASPDLSLDLDPVVTDPPACTEPSEGGRDREKPLGTVD